MNPRAPSPPHPNRRPHAARIALAALFAGAAALGVASLASRAQAPAAPAPSPLPSVAAQSGTGAEARAYDGVVEAVRQTVIAAQVAGAIVQLDVKAGDRVSAGQQLLRIDARAADQAAAASEAQVQAARAALDVARTELARQEQLFQKQYISAAALERAQAQFKTTQAQVNAQIAQAGAARTQTGLHVVRAPYAGVVSDVPVTLGDMAMPGRALLTLYDPGALRVSASVPQSVLGSAAATGAVEARAEMPGLAAAAQWPTVTRTQVLPTVDAGTHTNVLRLDLTPGLSGLTPGMFARVWLTPATAAGERRIFIPAAAVVRHAELTAVYVLDGNGQPLLRQVRLGRRDGERIEILSGISAGERVVTDPRLAARVR